MPNWHSTVIEAIAQSIWAKSNPWTPLWETSPENQATYMDQALAGLNQVHDSIVGVVPPTSELHATAHG